MRDFNYVCRAYAQGFSPSYKVIITVYLFAAFTQSVFGETEASNVSRQAHLSAALHVLHSATFMSLWRHWIHTFQSVKVMSVLIQN